MNTWLVQQQRRLQQLPLQRIIIALSGGLDSSVLLHLAWRLKQQGHLPNLEAWYVNHQLQSQADAWQSQLAQQCAALGVLYRAFRVEVKKDGQGVEAAARQARYQCFAENLRGGDELWLAQHADDQLETQLLRWLRGSGPQGLAGMPEQRSLARAQLYRPLLHLSRKQLEVYAQTWGLSWCEDPSNASEVFDRNYLRHQVVPLLRQRWPDLLQRTGRSALACRESQALLDEVAEQDYQQLASGLALDKAGFMTLSCRRQHNLLRYLCRQRAMLPPPERVLANLPSWLAAAEERCPSLDWPGASLKRYRQGIFLLETSSLVVPAPFTWQPELIQSWPGGRLLAESCQGRGVRQQPGQWQIRFRQGGETWQPVGCQHPVSVKHFLQSQGIPPWRRAQVPLLYCDETLVAVGQRLAQGWQAQAQQPGWWLHWQCLDVNWNGD